MEENLEKYRKTIELCSSIMKDIKAERMSNTKMGKYVNVFLQCIYNHRTTKTNQKYPSVNL